MANRWSSKYSRERKRVTSILRELRKAGYRFADDIIPIALPRAGRTEQSLKAATLELRKITRNKIYKQSTGRVTSSGEVLPVKSTAKERRRQTREIRSRGEQTIYETDLVLDRVETQMNVMSYDTYSNIIEDVKDKLNSIDISDYKHFRQYQFHHDRAETALNFLEMAIYDEGMGDEELGRKLVAERLQNTDSQYLNQILTTIMYDSNAQEVQYALTQFATIIRGSSLSLHEAEELSDMVDRLG